jgi:phage tail-like protein
MANDKKQVSRLLESLPAIFQEDSKPGHPGFLGRFLLAFERILLGLGEVSTEVPQPGLEEIAGGGSIADQTRGSKASQRLSGMERYFESGFKEEEGLPKLLDENERSPKEFLTWLAGWVSLTLREDWEDWQQRELIAKAVQLYRLRGTRQGLEDSLRIYTRLGVRIDEMNTPFQIGVHSSVGRDTLLDGGAPFFFHVHILLPVPDPQLIGHQREIATAIVDLQKPAYTYYALSVETPTFRIGHFSHVGMDTLIG